MHFKSPMRPYYARGLRDALLFLPLRSRAEIFPLQAQLVLRSMGEDHIYTAWYQCS